MAIMSGDAGVWPIGPAANPAKPAPSLTRPSKFDMGTSFADGLAFMSTNWAKKNSIPSSSARFLTASAAGLAMVVAIGETPFARSREGKHSHERRRISTRLQEGNYASGNNDCAVCAASGRDDDGARLAPSPSGTKTGGPGSPKEEFR